MNIESPQMHGLPVAILGTGMAGCGAGYALESAHVPFQCYDKSSHFGGHTRSIRYPDGFVFDEGGHISFTKDERIKSILAGNIDSHHEERKLLIDNYWHGLRIPHPVQSHLRGLPVELLVSVVTDFVTSMRQPSTAATSERPQTYASWLYANYGRTFSETFPMVYGEKYHTTTMDRLTTDWIGPRMYRPSLEEIIRGIVSDSSANTHYVDSYRYPSSGGFVSYLEPFRRRFAVSLGHRVIGIDPKAKLIRFENGAVHGYSILISSIALPELIPTIDGVPKDVADAAAQLAFTTAMLVNIGINREDISETAITYFYDPDIILSRVNLPHMLSANNAPPGYGSIQAEVYFSDKYKPMDISAEQLSTRVVDDLRRCGFIRDSDEILLLDTLENRYANIIYDLDRATALKTVHGFLDDVGIHYCGRYGRWNHAWTDQAFLDGEQTALQAIDRA